MRLLRRGQVSVREAAMIADVSRQRVAQWCEKAGIDPAATRQEWLAAILSKLSRKSRRR